MARQRLNNWWVPGEGIARVVIQADIQRYLGPDALVKPGENEGRQGFWITAYRTLTSEMIQDLKLDTQRWEREQEQIGRRGQQDQLAAYRDSTIHQSRQYYGPSTTDNDPYGQQQPAPRSQYDQSPNYTHSNVTQGYGAAQQNQGGYAVQPGYSQPRTHPSVGATYSPGGYQQQTSRPDYPGYSQPQHGGYSQPAYNYGTGSTSAPPPPNQSRPPVRPGFYLASDGKEYPIPAGGIPGQRRQ